MSVVAEAAKPDTSPAAMARSVFGSCCAVARLALQALASIVLEDWSSHARFAIRRDAVMAAAAIVGFGKLPVGSHAWRFRVERRCAGADGRRDEVVVVAARRVGLLR